MSYLDLMASISEVTAKAGALELQISEDQYDSKQLFAETTRVIKEIEINPANSELKELKSRLCVMYHQTVSRLHANILCKQKLVDELSRLNSIASEYHGCSNS